MRDAATEGIAILFPDTSPRGAGIEGEDVDWDFGSGELNNPTDKALRVSSALTTHQTLHQTK
jgi:hypothetical protein